MTRKIYTTDYLNNITETKFFYADRDVNDTMTLPYSFKDIKIKPNDLAVAHTINGSFSKLYDNLLYIISQSRLAQSIIPNKASYINYLATMTPASAGAIQSYASTLLPANSGTTSTSILTGVKSGQFFTHTLSSGTNCGIVVAQKEENDEIIMLEDIDSVINIKSVTTNTDNFTTRQLVSADNMVVDEEVLYILNSKNRVVYKYDILGLSQSDSSYFNPASKIDGKLLMDILGGFGDINDNVRFNAPAVISVDSSNNLYVVDTDTASSAVSAAVKKYDKNMNFKSAHDITGNLKGQTPKDMVFSRSRFYLLTDTSVHEFSTNFVTLNEWVLSDKLESNESYSRIIMSNENNNVVYIASNKSIYKKFISKLDKGIGKFSFTDRSMNISDDIDVSFVSSVSSTNGEVIYVGDNKHGVIYKFDENTDYQECIPSTFENTFITFDRIKIKSDEFINHIVYNKALAKLYYNHGSVANNISTRVTGEYGTDGILRFKSLRYLLPNEVLSRTTVAPITLDNYVGVNEVVMSSVINRTLEQIYKEQLRIVHDLKTEPGNRRPHTTIGTSTTPTTANQVTWVGDRWETLPNVITTKSLSAYAPTAVTYPGPTWSAYTVPVTSYDIGDTVSYTIGATPDTSVGGSLIYTTSSVELTAQPLSGAGLSLNSSTGEITGVLDSAELTESVSHYYTIRATDTNGNYADADFRIDIAKPPAAWIFNASYTFTWDSPSSQTIASVTDLSGSGSIAGTYVNATASLLANGPLYNNNPRFTNTGADKDATLFFNGSRWCIDLVDDAFERAVIVQRLSGTTTGYLSPAGDYYASDISTDRIGFVV